MKKMLSVILALTLCMALAVPAMAADYGKVTIETTFDGELVFEAATIEKTTIKAIERGLDSDDDLIIEDEMVHENATLITVKPGSTVQGSVDAGFYKLEEDGNYGRVLAGNVTLTGNVDDWFSPKPDFDGLVPVMYQIFDPDAGHYFIVLGEGDTASNDTQTPAPEQPAAPAAKPVVIATNQNLTVDGEAKETEIYNIDGSNYFKLRDMAALLNGTGSQFSVDFDGERNTIVVKTGEAYTSVGGELATGTDKSDSAVASAQSIEIDGEAVDLTAFNIGGNNFFKLRELGAALGFGVDYDEATATMLVTSK